MFNVVCSIYVQTGKNVMVKLCESWIGNPNSKLNHSKQVELIHTSYRGCTGGESEESFVPVKGLVEGTAVEGHEKTIAAFRP